MRSCLQKIDLSISIHLEQTKLIGEGADVSGFVLLLCAVSAVFQEKVFGVQTYEKLDCFFHAKYLFLKYATRITY